MKSKTAVLCLIVLFLATTFVAPVALVPIEGVSLLSGDVLQVRLSAPDTPRLALALHSSDVLSRRGPPDAFLRA